MLNRRLCIVVASATTTASFARTHSLSTAAPFSSAAWHRRTCTSKIGHQLNRMTMPEESILNRKNTITRQQMSFFGDEGSGGIQRIDLSAMKEIIEDVANSSREESGYVIIDVRGHDEIAYTGKLNDVVETLPLPYIAEGALTMEEDDFKEAFGFDKPGLDETLVFSCKAGIRSQHAVVLAKMAGYSDILDYMGGSNEWFSQ